MKMNTSKLALMALTGLMTAGLMTASLAHADNNSGQKVNNNHAMEKNACKGKGGCKTADKGAEKEKHACKGMNSCKGQGADGKNECAGKGNCSTESKTDSTSYDQMNK